MKKSILFLCIAFNDEGAVASWLSIGLLGTG
jgi:hypothetical protein